MEPWLRELAKVNREKQDEERNRLDERWDRLSSGDLSPEEEAELRALAETSEEAREAYEAFRPLGPDFHARVAGTLRERGLVPADGTDDRPAKLLPFRGRARRLVGWGSLAAAAAVAAVLAMTVLRPPAPISSYTASLGDGDRSYRGGVSETGGRKVFSPGSLLTLLAEPRQAFQQSSKVEARAFAIRGPELVSLRMKVEPAESGILKLQGVIGEDVQLSPGVWRIWVVVCRPGKLPTVDQVRGKLNAGRIEHAGCQATPTETFEVRDPT